MTSPLQQFAQRIAEQPVHPAIAALAHSIMILHQPTSAILAYGSAFGFTDLTGPAFAWLLHGPAPFGETAPVLFSLQSLHSFALNPALGGKITGAIALDEAQEVGLLRGWSYINIYTPENLGGELRGQLVVVPESSTLTFLLGIGALALLWRCAGKRRQTHLPSERP